MQPFSERIFNYMIPWLNLPWPLDLESVFGRSAELVLEIGFGDGAFLIDQAKREPERNFLGIEVAWEPINRLFKGLEKEGITNVRVIRSDAALVLERVLPPDCLSKIIINHPDPWPKERHWPRRLIQNEFLELLASCTKPGSQLRIATDHADYANWISDKLGSQDYFSNTLSADRVEELEGHLVTRYQSKAQKDGIPNNFFIWERSEKSAPTRSFERTDEMPNVVFKGELDMKSLFEDFESQVHCEKHQNVDTVINLMRAYQQTSEGHWMIEVMVQEGRLCQQVGILVLSLEDSRFTLKPSTIGYPRSTWGVKRALWHVARLLVAKNPNLEVVNSNVGSLLD